jgi:hypothetical protein
MDNSISTLPFLLLGTLTLCSRLAWVPWQTAYPLRISDQKPLRLDKIYLITTYFIHIVYHIFTLCFRIREFSQTLHLFNGLRE